jgi:hypothetical protein
MDDYPASHRACGMCHAWQNTPHRSGETPSKSRPIPPRHSHWRHRCQRGAESPGSQRCDWRPAPASERRSSPSDLASNRPRIPPANTPSAIALAPASPIPGASLAMVAAICAALSFGTNSADRQMFGTTAPDGGVPSAAGWPQRPSQCRGTAASGPPSTDSVGVTAKLRTSICIAAHQRPDGGQGGNGECRAGREAGLGGGGLGDGGGDVRGEFFHRLRPRSKNRPMRRAFRSQRRRAHLSQSIINRGHSPNPQNVCIVAISPHRTQTQ